MAEESFGNRAEDEPPEAASAVWGYGNHIGTPRDGRPEDLRRRISATNLGGHAMAVRRDTGGLVAKVAIRGRAGPFQRRWCADWGDDVEEVNLDNVRPKDVQRRVDRVLGQAR